MESGRYLFDPVACHGNMLYLGNSDSIFRGARTMMNMGETSKRSRPFFTSPEELFDEEYYDEQSPEKKRRLTPEQVHLLEKSFEAGNKLEPDQKTDLAKKLGLQPRQVAVWFQNRRARWKTKQLEGDYDLLKSSYDSLLSNYDCIAKENEKLKSEVVSLTEKLQAKEATGIPLPAHECEPAATDIPNIYSVHFSVKVEDRLSSGTCGSDVVDEDSPQLLDSGDSYFLSNDYPDNMVNGVHSEDDGSDDGRGYFSNVFAATEQQNHEEGEPLSWWVWP